MAPGLDLPFLRETVAVGDDGGRDFRIQRKGGASPVSILEQFGVVGGLGGGAGGWRAGGLFVCGHGLVPFVIGLAVELAQLPTTSRLLPGGSEVVGCGCGRGCCPTVPRCPTGVPRDKAPLLSHCPTTL